MGMYNLAKELILPNLIWAQREETKRQRTRTFRFKTRRFLGYRGRKKLFNLFQAKPSTVLGRLVRQTKPIDASRLKFKINAKTLPKSLFHIKYIFNLKEFLIYDTYNFYLSESKPVVQKSDLEAPWRKLNFLYDVRRHIKVFRTHTLRLIQSTPTTERRATQELKVLLGVHPLAYFWFFEFGYAVTLVKWGFAKSIKGAHQILASAACVVNYKVITILWGVVKPGDIFRLTFSYLGLVAYNSHLQEQSKSLSIMRRWLMKIVMRRNRYKLALGKKKQGPGISTRRTKHFHFFEADLKSFSVACLPLKKNSYYYSYAFMLWMNYWNYRTVMWKYLT